MKVYLCTPLNMSDEIAHKFYHTLHERGVTPIRSENKRDFKTNVKLMLDCDAVFLAPGCRHDRLGGLMYKIASVAKLRIYNKNQWPIVRGRE